MANVQVLMDDKSYFTYKHNKPPGSDGFYAADKENNPPLVIFYLSKEF